tara:strand:- start:2767 stop:2916 length:150 start_codon:yes stop_codon:yes gene_type:complete
LKKKYRPIQAGQDWSEWETWAGLGIAIAIVAACFYAGLISDWWQHGWVK